MEELFRAFKGVVHTEVGYAGGENENPTYEDHPGHAEAIEVEYDSKKVTYEELLDFFFRIHDPSTVNRQGNDVGSSYRSAIFFRDDEEKQRARRFIQRVNESKRWKDPVVTTLEVFNGFFPAEGYHQDYLQKNPGGYTCHFDRGGSYMSK